MKLRDPYGTTRGFSWRVGISIMIPVIWLSFLLIWLFFYASDYSVYRNLAIIMISLMVMGGVLGLVWMTWVRRYVPDPEVRSWRTWLQSLIGGIWFVFLIIWLYFYASDFDLYQNIAIFLVSVLIMGGLSGVVWSGARSRGMY